MKKAASLTAALALLLLLSAPARAAEAAPTASDVTGAITKLDSKAMMLTIKDADGAEKTLWWNKDTRISSKDGKVVAADTLKTGTMVKAKAAEKNGKWWISELTVQ